MNRWAKIFWIISGLCLIILVSTRFILGGWLDFMWFPKNDLNFIKNLYQKKVIINLYDGQVRKGKLLKISEKSRDKFI